MSNLLLGNGINMRYARRYYGPKAIRKRFRTALLAASPLIESYIFVPVNEKVLFEFDNCPENANIEELAAVVFQSIKEAVQLKYIDNSINLDLRILSAIRICALNSIFFDEEKFLRINIPAEDAEKLKRFSKIFSLNYCEFWDWDQNQCVYNYLHGSIRDWLLTIPSFSPLPVLLYDANRYRASQSEDSDSHYLGTVNELKHQYTMYPVSEYEFLFSPSNMDKIEASTLYPSNRLYAAWDLFLPPDCSQVYSELETLDTLSVFGVSPFGDDRLFFSVNKIPHVIIYVYNLKENAQEIAEWKKHLSRTDLEFRDSEDFWR